VFAQRGYHATTTATSPPRWHRNARSTTTQGKRRSRQHRHAWAVRRGGHGHDAWPPTPTSCSACPDRCSASRRAAATPAVRLVLFERHDRRRGGAAAWRCRPGPRRDRAYWARPSPGHRAADIIRFQHQVLTGRSNSRSRQLKTAVGMNGFNPSAKMSAIKSMASQIRAGPVLALADWPSEVFRDIFCRLPLIVLILLKSLGSLHAWTKTARWQEAIPLIK